MYCPVILTIMKLPQIFMNFFSSQITNNIEINKNLHWKIFMSSWKKNNTFFYTEISLYPQIVYCQVILTIMKLPQIFMNFFSSQVTNNIEIMENLNWKNFMSSWKKKTTHFLHRAFIVPTNCVLPSHPNNYEASKDFYKFFVMSSYNQSWNHGKPTIEKLYVI